MWIRKFWKYDSSLRIFSNSRGKHSLQRGPFSSLSNQGCLYVASKADNRKILFSSSLPKPRSLSGLQKIGETVRQKIVTKPTKIIWQSGILITRNIPSLVFDAHREWAALQRSINASSNKAPFWMEINPLENSIGLIWKLVDTYISRS